MMQRDDEMGGSGVKMRHVLKISHFLLSKKVLFNAGTSLRFFIALKLFFI